MNSPPPTGTTEAVAAMLKRLDEHRGKRVAIYQRENLELANTQPKGDMEGEPVDLRGMFHRHRKLAGRVRRLEQAVFELAEGEQGLMTTETDLQNTLDSIQSQVGQVAAQQQSLQDQIAALQAQVEQGGTVSRDQLAALNQEASNINSALQALTAGGSTPQAGPSDGSTGADTPPTSF